MGKEKRAKSLTMAGRFEVSQKLLNLKTSKSGLIDSDVDRKILSPSGRFFLLGYAE